MLAAVKRGSDKTIVCSKTVVAKKGSEAKVQDLCKQVRATAILRKCASCLSSLQRRGLLLVGCVTPGAMISPSHACRC